MLDFFSIGVELVKLIVFAVIGFFSKVLYDRRFAKRPDLRYDVQAPATFGTGERERVYQNLVVTNVGTERTDDVRIAFRRQVFETVEHQINFDGPHRTEIVDDLAVILISNIPPRDCIAISFVFSPKEAQVRRIEDFFVSVKASNCLGKPQESKQGSVEEFWKTVVIFVLAVALAGLVPTVWRTTIGPPPLSDLGTIGVATPSKEKDEVVRIVLQTTDLADRGREVMVEIFVENLMPDPFVGWVEVASPWRGGGVLEERINVGGGKRYSAQRKLKIPETVIPGRYKLEGEVRGEAFGRYGRASASVSIKVK